MTSKLHCEPQKRAALFSTITLLWHFVSDCYAFLLETKQEWLLYTGTL